MSTTVGITFREKMAGGFILGEVDPQSGAERGHAEGDALAMHATIQIQDLDRFIAIPEHLGGLKGTIDFPPLGATGIPSTSGVFNLFSPSDAPDTKYMVYELGFRLDAKDYYLAGKKIVKQAPITDMWKATTTLYTQLHQGADKTGPVIGAGILTLGVFDLIAMLATMHATDAQSIEQGASAVARFGRFFLGELWDTYVKHTKTEGRAAAG
jgi:cholesterol oxidase